MQDLMSTDQDEIHIILKKNGHPRELHYRGSDCEEEGIRFLSRNAVQPVPRLMRANSGLFRQIGGLALNVGKATAKAAMTGIEKSTNPETGIIGRKYKKEKKE
jgi:hypothetical protein